MILCSDHASQLIQACLMSPLPKTRRVAGRMLGPACCAGLHALEAWERGSAVAQQDSLAGSSPLQRLAFAGLIPEACRMPEPELMLHGKSLVVSC